MGFSKKANTGNTNTSGAPVDTVAYNEWNQYQFDCFNAKAKKLPNGKLRKEKTLIGKVNLIMDLGTPPAEDSKWQTKCALPEEGQEYSQEELDWKANNKGHDFVWDQEWDEGKKKNVPVRKQTSPSYPAQEYGVAIDFPQIMVDYSKHPNSDTGVEELRPLRISLNGSFHSMYPRTIVFDGSYKPVSDKNIIYKICAAAGREQELIDSQFDIATLAEAVCSFTVRLDLSEGDKIYLNTNAAKPSAVEDFVNPATDETTSAESQIEAVMGKEGIAPFVGILLDDDELTDNMLGMLGNDTFGYVKHASLSKTYLIEGISKKNGEPYSFDKGFDYQGSEFQVAWDKLKGSSTSSSQSNAEDNSGTPKQSSPEKKEAVKQAPSEPEMDDFLDDIPF